MKTRAMLHWICVLLAPGAFATSASAQVHAPMAPAAAPSFSVPSSSTQAAPAQAAPAQAAPTLTPSLSGASSAPGGAAAGGTSSVRFWFTANGRQRSMTVVVPPPPPHGGHGTHAHAHAVEQHCRKECTFVCEREPQSCDEACIAECNEH
jgi:hypothetical protein